MIEKYFTCALVGDVVVNASLATECNMQTLNYIPGSNFLGIVAASLYNDSRIDNDTKMKLFHTGDVSFGDALIQKENVQSYPVPNLYMQEKGKDKLGEHPIYLQHLHNTKDKTKQLKQKRDGYLNADGFILPDIKQAFSLKSAYDAEKRRTKESAMYGFNALCAGQEFIFSIRFTQEDKVLIELVTKNLVGEKSIGKSKSAQYGRVTINAIENVKQIEAMPPVGYVLVYAESNLCFTDECTGQSTLQPSAQQLGLAGGKIVWEKSQVRTYSYSPWNFKRNTSSQQRNCIQKGSVIYVEGADALTLKKQVGEYQAEGLGRVLYNPAFLQGGADGKLAFTLIPAEEPTQIKEAVKPNEKNIKTTLATKLFQLYSDRKKELDIAKRVVSAINDDRSKDLARKITSSQWGNIRALAVDSQKKQVSWDVFLKLLGYANGTDNEEKKEIEKKGMLTHGKMAEKLWNENRRNNYENILIQYGEGSLVFAAKFAAEMAKKNQSNKNNKEVATHD